MEKFKLLLSKCKCGVYVSVNEHRDVYEPIEEWVDRFISDGYHISDSVKANMILLDTIVDIHFYPDTPIGFYKVLHYSIDDALNEALSILEEVERGRS